MLRATAAAAHPVPGESGESHPFGMRLDRPLSARMSPRGIWLSIPGGAAPYETRIGEVRRALARDGRAALDP